MRGHVQSVIVVLALQLVCSPALANENDKLKFFEDRIRPVLVKECYSCHSVTSQESEGGVGTRLTSWDS